MVIFMSMEDKKNIIMEKYDDPEIPFGGGKEAVLIDFKCKKCGCEDKVPDFVAFECYIEEEFDRETGSPIVLCPKCESDMIIKRD